MTSCPMRGMCNRAPLLAGPACARRGSSRSCSRPSCRAGPSGTAPSRGRTCRCRSPRRAGPTTTAVCGPCTNGLGVGATRAELLPRTASPTKLALVVRAGSCCGQALVPAGLRGRSCAATTRCSRFWSSRGNAAQGEQATRRSARGRRSSPRASLELRAVLLDADAGVLRRRRPASRTRRDSRRPRSRSARTAVRSPSSGSCRLDARPLEVVVVVHVDARLHLAREVPAA